MRRLGLLAILTFTLMFLLVPPAQAYVDPASGSYALQIIVGAFAAIAAVFAMFWRKISLFFSRIFGRNKTKV